jgi:putative transcriptional regulator
MKNDMFEELLQSVREGGAILRGEVAPARAYSVADPDVAEVREIYGLSQTKFAGLLGISVRTLQNWEQRRRKPEGPARVLLRVAARHPEAVLDVVKEESKRKLRPTAAAKAGGEKARRKKGAKRLIAGRSSKSTKRATK